MSGAKNCPETPRQKMIGMMYLVLTAMLALNVSAEIINGYAAVDNSLHATIETTIDGNNVIYERFESALAQNPDKTREWYDKAQEVKKTSDEMYQYLQTFKNEMIRMVDGENAIQDTVKVSDMKKKDNTHVPHAYGLVEGHGAELKAKINEYAAFLEAECQSNANLVAEIKNSFATNPGTKSGGEPITWEQSIFEEMPICATVTVLSKFQNDVRNYEGKVVSYLLASTDAGDVRVNKMGAYIIPSSEYVIRGSKYHAQIILAGVDSTKTPEYYINGQKISEQGIYEVVANGIGEQRYKGQIAYQHLGETIYLPFEGKYTIGEPSVSIMHTELNIMFRGYNNPYRISVPGVSNDKLQVRCPNATVTKQNGVWMIKPSNSCPDSVTVEVLAEMDGKTISMPPTTYRVKDIPAPDAYFEADGKLVDDKISLSALTNPKSKVVASYGKDGLIQAKFTIKGFTIKMPNGQTYNIKGNQLSKESIRAIKDLKKGNTVTLMFIRAADQNGQEKTLRGLPLELN